MTDHAPSAQASDTAPTHLVSTPQGGESAAMGEAGRTVSNNAAPLLEEGNGQGVDGRGARKDAVTDEGTESAGAAAETTTGTRPPRPPVSIRQGRKDKRRAGWEHKKALMKERKRAERERR